MLLLYFNKILTLQITPLCRAIDNKKEYIYKKYDKKVLKMYIQ